jgi:hypothetical protein
MNRKRDTFFFLEDEHQHKHTTNQNTIPINNTGKPKAKNVNGKKYAALINGVKQANKYSTILIKAAA